MIEVIFFSIAGSQRVQEIDDLFAKWYDSEVIPKTYKLAIRYTLDIADEGGHYPESTYYSTYFSDTGLRHASVTEILHYAKQCEDFFGRQQLQAQLIEVFNTSATLDDAVAKVQSLVEGTTVHTDEDFIKPVLYSDTLDTPVNTVKSYIDCVDTLTGGFVRGQIATIGAFTGHGKSTAWLSIIYANAKRGKKCVYLSLELPVFMVWLELQARYLYEEKHVNVTITDLIQQKLNKEAADAAKKYEKDFMREIGDNIYVCDSSELSKAITQSSTAWLQLYRRWDKHLGGLDLVVHDHVGQYNLLYPDQGNVIVKLIQDCTVRFRSMVSGEAAVTGFAIQCNREGYRRACRREGVYDLVAIGDLNEVERSSAYVVFMFTPDEKKIMQETVVTVAKTRLGPTLQEPTPVSFIPEVITVGNSVEMVSYGDDFSDISEGFGEVSGGILDVSGIDDDL